MTKKHLKLTPSMSLFAKSPKPCKQTKLNIQRRDITTPIFISNHLKTCPHKKMPP